MRHINIKRRRRLFTLEEENAIRRRLFKENEDPDALMKELGISACTLRRIACGPIKRKMP